MGDEEAGHAVIGWERGVYPTFETAQSGYLKSELYVALLEGEIVASAIINSAQVDVYEKGEWQYDAADEEILVPHTLTVDPCAGGKGIRRFLRKTRKRKGKALFAAGYQCEKCSGAKDV